VENLGYEQFFIITALLGVPTLILIVLQWRRERQQTDDPTAVGATEQS
jgi:PAT family beta-lactamase induction signal transducer AmpG